MNNFKHTMTLGMLVVLLTLSANANKMPDFSEASSDDVFTTESGLKYRIVSEGEGPSPTANSFVEVYYHGYLPDGSVFDETDIIRPPRTFKLEGLIQGWQEALLKMKVGGIWELYIPSELAYGELGSRGVIPPNSDLIFYVELYGIK